MRQGLGVCTGLGLGITGQETFLLATAGVLQGAGPGAEIFLLGPDGCELLEIFLQVTDNY